MKPFDLEKALAGEPVVTRGGRAVKIAGYNKDAATNSTVAGWIGQSICAWSDAGRFSHFDESDRDIFMASKTRQIWVAVVRNGFSLYPVFGSSEQEVRDKVSASKSDLLSIEKLWEEEI